jgi:large subunit ribosomal protein L7A
MLKKFEEKKIVIGKKQTLRALSKDDAKLIYISRDADIHVTKPIVDACKDKNVEIIYFDNMKDLGSECGIDVNAAAAAVLK